MSWTEGEEAARTSLVRVERQGRRECLGMEERRALSALSVVRHDVEVVGAGPDGYAGGAQVVALFPTRQQHLTDGDAAPVKDQHPALPIHRDVQVAVAVRAHRS